MAKNAAVGSLKDLFYNTLAGRLAIVGTAICLGIAVSSYSCAIADKYGKMQIQQQQTVGNKQPDIYIEENGVKYFSHADGKSIEELVKER